MVFEASAILSTTVWVPRPGKAVNLGKAADLSTAEKRKQSVAAVWRGFYSRWEGPAAETIQRWWRGYIARRFVQALRHGRLLKHGPREWVEVTAAVVIQRHWRGWLGRRAAAERRKAVVDIQRWWKGYRARKEWPRLRLKWRARNYYAIDIQKWVRGHLARLRVRRMRAQQQQQQHGLAPIVRQTRRSVGRAAAAADPRREAAATVIQAHWRGRQARKRRAWLEREAAKRGRYERRLAAAKVIQSYYRGWYVRRAVARLRASGAGQPLQPGSLAGGVVAAPGVAGDVRNAVALPYGEYDDDDDDDNMDGRAPLFQRLVPYGHPRPPPLPRVHAALPAPRGRGGGFHGVVQRGSQKPFAPPGSPIRGGAAAGRVRAPGARLAAGSPVANVRQASQLRPSPALSPSPPPPVPSKQQPQQQPTAAAPATQPSSSIATKGVVPTAAGSGLSSIRAVRAAAAGGHETNERAKQSTPAVLKGPPQPQPQPQPKQQLKSVQPLGELRVRTDPPSPPIPAHPLSPTSPPGPLRSPPPERGGSGGGGGSSVRTLPASHAPAAPVTPPRSGAISGATTRRGFGSPSSQGQGPGPGKGPEAGPGAGSGGKPSTAPAPLERAMASDAAPNGLGFGGTPPSSSGDRKGDGADGGDANARPPALARGGGGGGSQARRIGAPTPLATTRTPAVLVPTANRRDSLRASAPEPLRISGGGGGGSGGGGNVAMAAASPAPLPPRRRAWESEGSIAAGSASAAAAAAAGPQTPRRRASAAATSPTPAATAAAADAGANPLHDQVMRANRGGRVVNGVVPTASTAATAAAAAAQRRRAAR